MPNTNDLFKQERTDVLRLFTAVALNNFGGENISDIRYAFNRAASYVEQQPGIVEYYHYGKENVGATDGTDFRRLLHDITEKSPDAEVRQRAYECLGSISQRNSDFVHPHYDLEKLRHRIFNDPEDGARAAALKAYSNIAHTKHANPHAFKSIEAQHTWVNVPDAGHTYTLHSYPPHPTVAYGLQPIPHADALAALCARALRMKNSPSLRLAAAEELRDLEQKYETGGTNEAPGADFKSLARTYVRPLAAQEQDPAVRAVLNSIIDMKDSILPILSLRPKL
ncbi:MAG: hypothetical protein PW788_01025 [Micavibrio sp.]|nr:hypothetical protein [Micavibrio sp.]